MKKLTQKQLKEMLHYEPLTGVFTWKIDRTGGVKKGSVAGRTSAKGYRAIKIMGKFYQSARLVWLYVYGQWPAKHIDHINCVRHDNRLSNLREATVYQNAQNRKTQRNNTSGHKGVCWNKKTAKWFAYIGYHGERKNLGHFSDFEAACAAYRAAASVYHREFARVEQ